MLEGSKIQLLKKLCEQERTQILATLMLPMENPRLVGYMLTGNLSMLLLTKCSLAWLYHCPWGVLCQIWWTNAMIKSLSSTKIQSSLSNHSLDKHTRMLKFRIAPTGLRISSSLTWKMRTRGHCYTHSRTQETTSGIRTKRCNSCIQKSLWWSRRCWNLNASTIIWVLGQYPHQCYFKESFTKNLSRTHCPQRSSSWTRTILLLCPANRLLCGQHDFSRVLQKSIFGHVWINCLCFENLRNDFFCFLFIRLLLIS